MTVKDTVKDAAIQLTMASQNNTECLLCFRLWQEQLKSHDQVWEASGVFTVPNRHGSSSWKELVAISVS